MQVIKNTLLVLFSCAFFLTVWIVGTIIILGILFSQPAPKEERIDLEAVYGILIGEPKQEIEKSFWDLSLKEIGAMFLTKELYTSHGFWHGVAGIMILILSVKLIRRNKALANHNYNLPMFYEDHEGETLKWLGLGAFFAFMILRVFVGALSSTCQEPHRNQLRC